MEYIKKGKDSFRRGLTCDESGDFENAFIQYQQGIRLFLTGIKFVKRENFKVLNRDRCIYAFPNEELPSEKDEEMKKKIVETAVRKCQQFMNRAEQIKLFLHKKDPQKYPLSPEPEQSKKEVDKTPEKKDLIKKKPEKQKEEEEEGITEEQKTLRRSIEDSILKEKPNVKWSDVAGNEVAKKALEEAIILPRKYPQLFVGKRKPWKCVLLYGPPGTGKTYLAKALATRMGDDVNFFSVSSSSLTSKWLGESEKLVRALFEMSIREAPSVIFIDEIDSLAGKRGGGEEHESSRRMKTEFFVQIQKLMDAKANVVLLGATNRPFDLDPAMRRRFEKRIYIPLPDYEARMGVLKVHAGKDIDITRPEYEDLGKKLKGYSCSDISVCVRDALMIPVRRAMKCPRFLKFYDANGEVVKILPCYKREDELRDGPVGGRTEVVEMDLLAIDPIEAHTLELPRPSVRDLYNAIERVPPSVSQNDLKEHEDFTTRFGQEG